MSLLSQLSVPHTISGFVYCNKLLNSEVLPLIPRQFILRIRRFPKVSFGRSRSRGVSFTDDESMFEEFGLLDDRLFLIGVLHFRGGDGGFGPGEWTFLGDDLDGDIVYSLVEGQPLTKEVFVSE